MVANSALDVVAVNGRDATKLKFWAKEKVIGRKRFVIIIYFTKYYKVIV